jgi:hypothetical protein
VPLRTVGDEEFDHEPTIAKNESERVDAQEVRLLKQRGSGSLLDEQGAPEGARDADGVMGSLLRSTNDRDAGSPS